jgi:CheY-like chemotaxis protein
MTQASTPRSILIVEDDADIQESVADILSLEGYQIFRANHGADALQQLKAGIKVQLILLDLMMPVMDGFQFRERVLKDDGLSTIPILIMSADGHVKEKLARIGAKAYLQKPVDMDDLIRSVKTHLL